MMAIGSSFLKTLLIFIIVTVRYWKKEISRLYGRGTVSVIMIVVEVVIVKQLPTIDGTYSDRRG